MQPSPKSTFRTFLSLQIAPSCAFAVPKPFFLPTYPQPAQEKQDSLSANMQIFPPSQSVHERCSPSPDFINKVFIPNLSSEKPKNSFSIPSICLNPLQYLIKPQILKMIIPTLSTGSHSVSLPLSFFSSHLVSLALKDFTFF